MLPIGALAAALGGLDRIVFTGGIGENDEICSLGFVMDEFGL
ncbi:MAG TPA: hypothetical protein VKG25_10735 [Bryobacteraceae bacterium]|nr:hypothetical protein [Bryobacteraceae bacterium]